MTYSTHASRLGDAGDIEQSVRYFCRLDVPQSARILDIGTRYGSFLQQLQRLDYHHVFGIDVESSPLYQGQKVYPSLASRLVLYKGGALPFASGTLDVVTMFDVIEHIPDIEAFLNEVSRILKDGGLFVFQTPNLLVNAPWEIVQRRSLTLWRRYHCSLQTLPSLRGLLAGAGLRDAIIEKHGSGSPYKRQEARSVLGPIGPLLVAAAGRMPLFFYPNFWGYARKPAG